MGENFLYNFLFSGRVAEWSNAPVLKTGDVQASVGSNPTPSASIPDSLHFGDKFSLSCHCIITCIAHTMTHFYQRQSCANCMHTSIRQENLLQVVQKALTQCRRLNMDR